jgi:two-component system, NtrC family, sensor kinase
VRRRANSAERPRKARLKRAAPRRAAAAKTAKSAKSSRSTDVSNRKIDSSAQLREENARLLNELRGRSDDLREALEQQTATSEVLKVISSSLGDLQPVFSAILESAARLCDASFGNIFRWDDDALHLVATYNTPAAFAEARRRLPFRRNQKNPIAQMLAAKTVLHVDDLAADQRYTKRRDSDVIAAVELGGVRTFLAVPMLKDNDLIGVLIVYRQEVRPFSDKQIELVRSFAAQAVIAVENARLLSELRESLEQQTATSDVLKVISRSTFDLQTVLNTLVESATRLCEAQDAYIFLPEGDQLRGAARFGFTSAHQELIDSNPIKIDRTTVSGRTAIEGRVIHIADVLTDPEFSRHDVQKISGFRAALGVPLLREGNVIGVIFLSRAEPEPFTSRQIELVTTFADQAVIAIENVRLFDTEQQRTRELTEALEQQTATSEVLSVISSSAGELQPVFETMLAKAVDLCEASFGAMWLVDGEGYRTTALHGDLPEAYIQQWRSGTLHHPKPVIPMVRAVRARKPVHVLDMSKDQAYLQGDPLAVSVVDIAGIRTLLTIPMLKGGEAIGVITIYRKEVRAFSDKQITVIQNFAAQAVIAVENARLLSELRESLEQQTAASEVLRVISSSPGELEPVFEAILENAVRLCDAKFGNLWLREGNRVRIAAIKGGSQEYRESLFSEPVVEPDPQSAMGRIVLNKEVVQIDDISNAPTYGERLRIATIQIAKGRTLVGVPMLNDDQVIGVIGIYRQEVRSFTDKQIELLKNFAAQAVIAIENARLLNELRQRTTDLSESLEQQTATSEVLGVISSSAGELDPVFQTMLANATRICEAKFGILFRFEPGGMARAAATHGVPPAFAEFWRLPRRPGPRTALARVAATKQTVYMLDVKADPAYIDREQILVAAVELGGFRTFVNVPLLKDNELIGVFAIYRQEVRPFTEKQIALVQNFAAQAVIAIENARLLSELRERTTDLSESLEQQTATSEVLKVISSSSGELQPVFHALLEKATQLCAAKFGNLYLAEGDAFRTTAMHNVPAAFAEARGRDPVIQPEPGSALDRIRSTKRVLHIPDVALDKGFIERQPRFVSMVELGGFRAMLAVPMLKYGSLIGAIMVYRQETGDFSGKQIELVQNFAAQAVIAIENARLLNELRDSLRRQTATSEVLQVISSSTFDLEKVFATLLETAMRLCESNTAAIWRTDGDVFRLAAARAPAEFAKFASEHPITPTRGTLTGRAALDGRTVHIPDVLADPEHTASDYQARGNYRSGLGVPLLREGETIGVFALTRSEVRPFSDTQIELVQNFAAQAVVAIENVRLLNELHESLQQQSATADVLKVISRSAFDLQTVLDTLVESAARLCDSDSAAIHRPKGDSYPYVASYGLPDEYNNYMRSRPLVAGRGTVLGRAVIERKPVQVTDVQADPEYTMREGQRLGGFRTVLGIPLLREGVPIGVIMLTRNAVRPFTEKQIELATTFADQAVIAIENVRLFEAEQQRTRELSESLEQQTATSEVLKVISSSQGELQPVFDVILENATKICEAKFGNLVFYDGDIFRRVAAYNAPPAWAEADPRRTREQAPVLYRLLDTREVVHIGDVAEVPGETLNKFTGARALLLVPMFKTGELVGGIGIYRQEVRPFTEKQISLLQSFADQAVIAIENARLLNELRQRTNDLTQSLEQQTATAEVLRVISNSPTDVQPVFDSIAESAVRLCGAEFSFVLRFDGEAMHFASCFGLSTEGLDFFRSMMPMPAAEDTASGRAIVRRAVVEIPDVEADDTYGAPAQGLARTVTYRSIVAVPLLHEGNPIGAFAVGRANAGSFPARQIALLQAFADQAVIAIRNVRLFDEVQARTNDLTESLEQQTATSEVLKVISNSVSDLQAVFDTMAENAVRLCEAERAYIFRFDGKYLQAVASYNVGPENWEYVSRNPITPGRHTVSARAALERRTVQVSDIQADPEYTYVVRDVEPIRTVLAVPIVKGDELVGTITIYKLEVKPFTDKQVALVETFAAQAVIAIENTRLLNELRESLQQQTATADVLKAISRSTFDLNTVLQTLVEAAARLCEADQGTIAREQEGVFVRAATYGFSAQFTELVSRMPIERERGSATGRALLEGRTIHIPDVQSDPEYTFNQAKELGGYRTVLAVPMLRNGAAIGVLTLTRIEVRPFTEKQIELVATFADQAAIAIENVRLFESAEARTRELGKSLEELRTAQDRLVQTQKLASLGQLTAGIAHEIKNPLNFVNNFSGVSGELLDELKETIGRVRFDEATHSELNEIMETLRGNLDKIVQHGKRADSIVKNMLLHSREGSGEHRPVDINLVLEESLNLAYHGARAEKQGFNITLERSFDPGAGEVDLFPQEITRVFLNLISNGFYAATKRKAESGDESYEPTLLAATKSLGDRVEIRIRDNGTGIPPEVKERMFNPFFTTKPAGEGTGLGLSISHDIVVKQHAGTIEVESRTGEFTEFRIVLPRTAAFIAKTGGRA